MTDPSEPVKDRPRRRRYLRVLVPIVLLGSLAAGYGIFREVRQPLIVACFREADLGSDRAQVSSDSAGAIEACAVLWRPGGQFHLASGDEPPPLSQCVLESGTLAVFPALPGRETCVELGLAPPDEEPAQEETTSVRELQERLSNRFLASCVGEPEALRFVEGELRELGLTDWQVVVSVPFDGERRCASVAFDVSRRVIQLIPIRPS